MSDDYYLKGYNEGLEVGKNAREALRAENERLRDINRWNIERDGDDVYICESNHHRSDKCEYERWYPRAYVEALRTENERLREALKPFAYYASLIPDDISDTCSASGTVGDLRAALKALGENELVIEISVINDI